MTPEEAVKSARKVVARVANEHLNSDLRADSMAVIAAHARAIAAAYQEGRQDAARECAEIADTYEDASQIIRRRFGLEGA